MDGIWIHILDIYLVFIGLPMAIGRNSHNFIDFCIKFPLCSFHAVNFPAKLLKQTRLIYIFTIDIKFMFIGFLYFWPHHAI